MKKYWRYFITNFKLNTAYKADFITGLFIDIVFFFISFALWKTIYSEGNINTIGSYNLRDTITYFFATSIIFRLEVSGSIYLGWQIWSGYFTNDLTKPWNIPFISILDVLAEKSLVVLLYVPMLLIIYFSAKNYLILPDLSHLLLFIVTTLIGMAVAISFNLIIHAMTFFFGDQDANVELVNYVGNFFAGAMIPLTFLPFYLYKLTTFLPFKYIFYVPIEVFLGKLTLNEIFINWGVALLWITGFYIIFRVAYKKGLRHYTGTGR